MRHSIEELLAVVYRHYPRGTPYEDPRYDESEETRRLSDAYRAVDEAAGLWRAMLDRLAARFPDRSVDNGGLVGACCNGVVLLRTAPGEHLHLVGFLMGFLVPCYAVYGCRMVDAGERKRRTDITLEAGADEQTYWTAVSSEIESTFECELLPPSIGRIRVPDVATKMRRLGQATLYDCLLSDSFGLSGTT